jgi:hypothetical protein
MLHNTSRERLAKDKQSSLLGPFKSYKEYEVLGIWSLGWYSQTFLRYTYDHFKGGVP